MPRRMPKLQRRLLVEVVLWGISGRETLKKRLLMKRRVLTKERPPAKRKRRKKRKKPAEMRRHLRRSASTRAKTRRSRFLRHG